MTKIKIGENEYEASFLGAKIDSKWNNRESVEIKTSALDYATINTTFVDGLIWAITEERQEEVPITTEDEGGNIVETGETKIETVTETYDMSVYCVAGNITDYRDGYFSVKMGKKTALENTTADLTEAQNVVDVLMGGATV